MSAAPMSGRLAILVGGGPAPGINGVISSVALEAMQHGIEVLGCQDGFRWLVLGSAEHVRRLTTDDVEGIHLQGGSVLGTSRTNPAKSDADMANVLKVFKYLNIGALVTIGGDDTAFSCNAVYLRANGAVRVAHVPKTIDNDLPLPPSTPTFGFETARHFGCEVVRHLGEDARTTSRWYIVVSMGRAAGHLALGIGKVAATVTIIPEEFRGRPLQIDEVCDILVGAIIKRRALHKPFGVAVLAEGLIESLGEEGLKPILDEGQMGRYGELIRDPHGHLRLGEIDFARMIKDRLAMRLDELGLNTTLVDKEVGYELRCADPIPFDAEYTRDLGYGAVKFILSEESRHYGAVVNLVGGRLQPLRFEDVIDPKTKRMQTRVVDVDGESYQCARRYMARLEKSDFDDPEKLSLLARCANMSVDHFRKRFGYLVES